MALSPYKGKTLAECKDLSFGAVRTNKNGYKYIPVKGPGLEYEKTAEGETLPYYCLYLGVQMGETVKVGEKVSRRCKIVLTKNEDLQERWKLARPEVDFYTAEELEP
jgi:hypothetical protein